MATPTHTTRPAAALAKRLLCATAACIAVCSTALGAAPQPLRVLFIGNSLTYGNDLPGQVAALAAQAGRPIEVGMFAQPNYSLEEHLRDRRLDAALAPGWDIAVLQQGPSSTPANRIHLSTHAQAMVQRMAGKVERTVLFAPWPQLVHLHTAADALTSYRQAATRVGGCVLPVVSAWMHQLSQGGGVAIYSPDGLHATAAGTRLAALTIARGLVGAPATSVAPAPALEASAAAAYVGDPTECKPAARAPSAGALLPQDGFWSVTGRPGSGIFIDRRGELLGIGLFGFDPAVAGVPRWWVGAGALVDGVVRGTLASPTAGGCFDCEQEWAGAADHRPREITIRFESARRAEASIDGAATVAITALAFGQRYVEAVLTDAVDGAFGPLPLPDLGGEWAVAVVSADTRQAYRMRLDGPVAVGTAIVFAGGDGQLSCRPATAVAGAGCAFSPSGDGAPWSAALGDIGTTLLHGSTAAGERVLGVRLDATVAEPPSSGFWFDPAEPGIGLSLQREGANVAAVLYDFAEDAGGVRQRWRLGAAVADDDGLVAELLDYHGGDCLGCAPPPVASAGGQLRMVFDGAASGSMSVSGQVERRIVRLAFGGPYLEAGDAALPLPDLSGQWLFDAGTPAVARIDRIEADAGRIVFASDAGGAQLTITCAPSPSPEPRCTAQLQEPGGSSWQGTIRSVDITDARVSGTTSDGVPIVGVRLAGR